MLQLVTRLHAGVRAASRRSPSFQSWDRVCASSIAPIALVYGTSSVRNGCFMSRGACRKPPDSALLLSYSDIQWLFPMDLSRLSLHLCQDQCTSGKGKCRLSLARAGQWVMLQQSAWERGTDLRQLLLVLQAEGRCCVLTCTLQTL